MSTPLTRDGALARLAELSRLGVRSGDWSVYEAERTALLDRIATEDAPPGLVPAPAVDVAPGTREAAINRIGTLASDAARTGDWKAYDAERSALLDRIARE